MSVYVGRLDNNIQKEDLEKEFSRFGKLTRVWVARNPPGFAFIDFQRGDDAKKAIKQMNGAIINRSKIRVEASCGGSMRGKARSDRMVRFHGVHGDRGRFGKGQAYRFHRGFRHRGTDFLRGGQRYQGGGTDRISRYHTSRSDIAWTPVGVLDCPDLIASYEDSSKCESSGKKRKLSGAENISRESAKKKKEHVEESNDVVMNINCLPEEILLKIFGYINKAELRRIAWVCKRWFQVATYPVLWKKVNLKLFQKSEFQSQLVASLYENLPMYVTHLKLDFQHSYFREFVLEKHLEFEVCCIKLAKRCPSIKTFVLYYAELSISLQTVIDLCIQYMQNLETLSIRYSRFDDYSYKKIEYGDRCKIKLLDLSANRGFGDFDKLALSKISSLKKLIIPGSSTIDRWFEDDTSFLDNLEVLSLRFTFINSSVLQTIKNHAFKLTELDLCATNIVDSYLRFDNQAFPQLKTLCLTDCFNMTCEALISLVQSCRSLQNIFVDHIMAASYAQHPYVIANKCKLQIVKIKSPKRCSHFKLACMKDDYL